MEHTNPPKVSITIPAYQNLPMLIRLLDSIQVQSFTDYEVIVTDNTPGDEVKEYVEAQGLDIRYHHNIPPLSSRENWNLGMELSRGEYIKVMFADDFFSGSDSLAKMVELLEKDPDADIAFCGTWQVSETERYVRSITPKQVKKLKQDYRYLYAANVIGAPSAVILRNRPLRFCPDLLWLVDVELYLRILQKNPHFSYTTQPLVSIGIHDGQVTSWAQKDPELNLKDYTAVYQTAQLSSSALCQSVLLSAQMMFQNTPWRTLIKEKSPRVILMAFWHYLKWRRWLRYYHFAPSHHKTI